MPINTMHDMNFSNTKLTITKEEFEECANRIKSFI
jgi:hypothetical protein